MKPFLTLCALLAGLSVLPSLTAAQDARATVTVKDREFRTYPYSDPDPVAHPGAIYPYFRFQGYTAVPVKKTWKVVTLENAYIRVDIAPQMGGKILGAIEKSTGRPFIYYNNVVKFREIAMRGPWTSGGVEFNFGDLGHAPTTASPVDYLTRTNADGSVSCIVGTTDLASRTVWRVEVRLPADKAYVETRSFWYNPTDLTASRYHWMNGAADAADDLEFIYPGSAFIGHDGELGAWPINPQGRDISKYRNNDFGSYKSYHVLGKNTDFFGALWSKRDLGVLHWSRFADKPGKKIWIWGHSREGMIWHGLLTDPDLGNSQYVEIQSGIHFNQPTSRSYLTPFKHMAFPPSSAEQFTECWMPFRGLRHVVAADPEGALDVETSGNGLQITFCPLASFDDTLTVRAAGRVLATLPLHTRPLEPVRLSVPSVPGSAACSVAVGARLTYATDGELFRPLERPLQGGAFDWSDAYGLFMDARERMRQRDYDGAYEAFGRSLGADPSFLPSLTGIAECAIRRFDTTAALQHLRKALAIDAYDADANYLYGLVQRSRARFADAEDGFGFAARSAALRPAASVQLAEMAYARGNVQEAEAYARQALEADGTAMRALRLLATASRITGDRATAEGYRQAILALDPLDHFARWEAYRDHRDSTSLAVFRDGLRGEFPHESCQEIAAAYLMLGLPREAIGVLRVSPQQPIVQLWMAYLLAMTGQERDGQAMLEAALKGSAAFVFPYRDEDEPVLRWAAGTTPSWQIPYLRALLYWSRGRLDMARDEFAVCGNVPDLPAFYLARASFALKTEGHTAAGVTAAEADHRKALAVGPDEWRAHLGLTEFFASHGRLDEARIAAEAGARRFPASYALQLALARTKVLVKDLAGARAILDTLAILPFEGAKYGREAHRFVYVMSALDALHRGKTAEVHALLTKAREWPERLGSGKPYDTDERVEDLIDAVASEKAGDAKRVKEYRGRIMTYSREHADADRVQHVIGVLVLKEQGMKAAADSLLASWRSRGAEQTAQAWGTAFLQGDREKQRAIEAAGKPEMDQWSGDADLLLVRRTVEELGLR